MKFGSSDHLVSVSDEEHCLGIQGSMIEQFTLLHIFCEPLLHTISRLLRFKYFPQYCYSK
ncbi:uncharacterized protein BDZ83DRAFT_458220 [Colletotrichum acutatum]|uniref:Uncharacterized protein n=1 Tax=Glomerella acutata TaxID=27357 RepID=A0AAD8UJG5_GLOAC|nr:uncharacterized protein BDZ83DRAFT_458220 [Colletotrichum acutatum]KAK1720144.1 hypothetical protein BDZ83DRAFT_458220 [Colletotrichum acutatum]